MVMVWWRRKGKGRGPNQLLRGMNRREQRQYEQDKDARKRGQATIKRETHKHTNKERGQGDERSDDGGLVEPRGYYCYIILCNFLSVPFPTQRGLWLLQKGRHIFFKAFDKAREMPKGIGECVSVTVEEMEDSVVTVEEMEDLLLRTDTHHHHPSLPTLLQPTPPTACESRK